MSRILLHFRKFQKGVQTLNFRNICQKRTKIIIRISQNAPSFRLFCALREGPFKMRLIGGQMRHFRAIANNLAVAALVRLWSKERENECLLLLRTGKDPFCYFSSAAQKRRIGWPGRGGPNITQKTYFSIQAELKKSSKTRGRRNCPPDHPERRRGGC